MNLCDPVQICRTCARSRDCRFHLRAEFPPTAAKRWLMRTCPRDRYGCEIVYHTGIGLSGPVTAQEATRDPK